MDTIKKTGGDRLFMAGVYLILSIVLLLVAYPLIYIVACSFSSSQAVITGQVFLWPVEPTLLGYQRIFENPHIVTGFRNSVLYTIGGTVISLFLTLTAAYPLSRKSFFLRRPLMTLFTITMLFSGGMIPTYMLVSRLGLINSPLAVILPSALSVYNLIVARTFFQNTIPDELLDASYVDGCSDFRFFLSIVLPLSGAIIAVMALFYAVSIWNGYFGAMIYLNDNRLYPLQLILRQILVQNQVDPAMMSMTNVDDLVARQGLAELIKYSLIVVSSLPMLIVYPFVQKYFVKGMMIGAIKG